MIFNIHVCCFKCLLKSLDYFLIELILFYFAMEFHLKTHKELRTLPHAGLVHPPVRAVVISVQSENSGVIDLDPLIS